jgi:hypothetical protein
MAMFNSSITTGLFVYLGATVFPRKFIRVGTGFKVGIISIGGDKRAYRLRSNLVSKGKEKEGYLK